MSDTTICTNGLGPCCSKCGSPDVATQIVDEDDEVLAGSVPDTDNLDCTGRPGCGCSKCQAPNVLTATGEWDPAVMAFGSPGPITGTVYWHGSSFFYTFWIYPGDGLDYARLSWYTDQDWPDNAVLFFDDEWIPIPVDEVFPIPSGGMPVHLQFIPDENQVGGIPTGNIVVDRFPTPNPGDSQGPVDTNESELGLPVEDPPTGCIYFSSYDEGPWDAGTSYSSAFPGGSTKAGVYLRNGGFPSDMWYRVRFVPDSGWPADLDDGVWNGTTELNQAQIHGPVSGSPEHLDISFDATNLGADDQYWGTLYVDSYMDAAGSIAGCSVSKRVSIEGLGAYDATVDILSDMALLTYTQTKRLKHYHVRYSDGFVSEGDVTTVTVLGAARNWANGCHNDIPTQPTGPTSTGWSFTHLRTETINVAWDLTGGVWANREIVGMEFLYRYYNAKSDEHAGLIAPLQLYSDLTSVATWNLWSGCNISTPNTGADIVTRNITMENASTGNIDITNEVSGRSYAACTVGTDGFGANALCAGGQVQLVSMTIYYNNI